MGFLHTLIYWDFFYFLGLLPIKHHVQLLSYPKTQTMYVTFLINKSHQNPHGKGHLPKPNLICVGFTFGWGLLLFLRVIYTLFLELTVPTRNQSTKNSLRLVCPQIFSKKFNAVSFINSNLNLLLELFHKKLYIYNILITNYRR